MGVAAAVGEGDGEGINAVGTGVSGRGEGANDGVLNGETEESSNEAGWLHPLMDPTNNIAMIRTAAFFIKVSLHTNLYEYNREYTLCQEKAFGPFL